MKTNDERLRAVESSLFGDESRVGALHRIEHVENLINGHVKECRETRRELRMWLMGILGTVLGAAIIAWLRFS